MPRTLPPRALTAPVTPAPRHPDRPAAAEPLAPSTAANSSTPRRAGAPPFPLRRRVPPRAVMVFATVAALALAGPAAGQPTLRYDPPGDWIEEPAPSPMRAAQFRLPRVPGDPEDGELVVFYFGGSGGTVEANLERWVGQMEQPDGRPSFAVASTTAFAANGLDVVLLDVPGTYVAAVRPGAAERLDKPGFRLLAAVVETPAGPWFFKLTGPARTIDRWDAPFNAFLRTVHLEPPEDGGR